MELNKPRKVVVISGPSGVGKSTIVKIIFEKLPHERFGRVVTTTTRKRREHEADGVDYYFKTREQFIELIKEGKMIEHTEIFNNFYGIQKVTLDNLHARGKIPIAVVDHNGAFRIKELGYLAILIYIDAPSEKELEARLRNRGADEKTIRIRLDRVKEELSQKKFYDRIVVNDDINRCSEEVLSIILKFAEQ